MDGRRLSQLRWLSTYLDGLPVRKQSPIQEVTDFRFTSPTETK